MQVQSIVVNSPDHTLWISAGASETAAHRNRRPGKRLGGYPGPFCEIEKVPCLRSSMSCRSAHGTTTIGDEPIKRSPSPCPSPSERGNDMATAATALPLPSASARGWQARQGELARERAGVRGCATAARYSAASAGRSSSLRSVRSIQSLVSFSCRLFWRSRSLSAGKSTRSSG